MAHINTFRNLDHRKKMHVKDAFSSSLPCSFGAFCGRLNQRNTIGLYELSRVVGSMGAVILHNDPQFELQLRETRNIHPQAYLGNNLPIFLARSPETKEAFYDPLYGLSKSSVLEVLAPRTASENIQQMNLIQAILNDYLSIMEHQFRKNPTVFGEYPYNLDLLYDLVSMSYSDLEHKVLNFLPDELSISIRSRLSANGAQQLAYNTVFSFARSMEAFIWKRRGFAGHTRLSIISTVKSRRIISIQIPTSKSDVLDYLAVELQLLINEHFPFMLLENGLNLNSSPRLKAIFLNDHEALPYYTGILSENVAGMVDAVESTNDLANLFSQSQEIFVFSCPNTLSAQPFSDGIGNYYRTAVDRQFSTHREPFHLLGAQGAGGTRHEVSQRIIDPEELTELGNGCLLFGKNYSYPILVDSFII
ncbi:MAG: hypothetical protein K5697_08955 [Lachnospiraceae bacterium]|nr:hypothetical protein [Lachnospiraceae bacterium]